MDDVSRTKEEPIRETPIGDYCANCGRYLDKDYKQCPDCRSQLKEDKEINNGSN